jgi:CRP-like cAMP-binding protein
VRRKYDRLLRKLELFGKLTDEDKHALISAVSHERHFSPREDIIQQRRGCEGVHLILGGFACRYKLQADGRRQILGFLLPGDICDIRACLLHHMDHSICALNTVTTALIPSEPMLGLLGRSPRLARTLWCSTIMEDSITREWIINVGHRTAFERAAHLFCEMFWRLESLGMTRGNECDLPITQIELGETLALSSVHVNRTVMDMRRANLVRLHGGLLELLDRDALQSAGGFDPGYLHLEGAHPLAMGSGAR